MKLLMYSFTSLLKLGAHDYSIPLDSSHDNWRQFNVCSLETILNNILGALKQDTCDRSSSFMTRHNHHACGVNAHTHVLKENK